MHADVRHLHFAIAAAWLLAALSIAASIGAALLAAGGTSESPWKPLLVSALFAVPGALIAAGRPRIAIGWLLLAVALLFGASGLVLAWLGTSGSIDTAGAGWAIWFVDRFSALIVTALWLAVMLLPDGRLPSRRWLAPVAVVAGVQVAVVLAYSLTAGSAASADSEWPAGVANPVGTIPAAWTGWLTGLDWLFLQLPWLLVPVAAVVRLRRAPGEERRRLIAVLAAGIVLALVVIAGHAWWPDLADITDVAAGALLAVTLTSAVLRRRLEALDFAVHHGIVFVVLSALIAGVYVLVTALLAGLGQQFPPAAAGVVAAVVALSLLPLRSRLQGLVDRMLFGDRHDPLAAISRIAGSTHDRPTVESAMRALAVSVRRSLRIAWVQVDAAERSAEDGVRPPGVTVLALPLALDAGIEGSLSVATGPARRLSEADRRLLAELARHGGIAIRAGMLSEAVAESRRRLVEAREEERRRLGRDLHDELGPTLASITMQLSAVRQLIDGDPDGAAERLAVLEAASRGALARVRSIARELRPPVLDQVGLDEALRRVGEDQGVALRVDAQLMPPLPAAVETAAYRIGAEAIANVARHSTARAAILRIEYLHDHLLLSVSDDGPGMMLGASWGVGLGGMRERAEELGGSFELRSDDRGTSVMASLPTTTVAHAQPSAHRPVDEMKIR
ncbi:MAG: sensor histidine kinase [Actinomycetota bacterium]|nr:sensor histidine kinase [Actinomycetota bacterium]